MILKTIVILSARLMTQNTKSNVSYFTMASHIFLALRLGDATGSNLGNLIKLSEAGAAHSISVYYNAVATNASSALRGDGRLLKAITKIPLCISAKVSTGPVQSKKQRTKEPLQTRNSAHKVKAPLRIEVEL